MIGTIFNYVVSIFALGVIIFAHELGHFLIAKRNGVYVSELAIGMGPKIFSFKRGETCYSLRLVPFGGSCMMPGEMGEVPEDDPEYEEIAAIPDDRLYTGKSIWTRISIILAGPAFNFLLALVCSIVIMGSIGVDKATLIGVMEGYPAEEAGLEEGDTITKLNNRRIVFYRDISLYLQFQDPEKPVEVTYERDGEEYQTEILMKYDEEDDSYYLGIMGSSSYREKVSPISVLRYSVSDVRYYIEATVRSLEMLFTGQASLNDLSGPVGITSMMSDTVEAAKTDGPFYVFLNILNLVILISANLGIMNLLPIPALDGGRLLFLVIELVRGKPVRPEREGMVNLVGILLLVLLMVVVMFNDIRKLLI